MATRKLGTQSIKAPQALGLSKRTYIDQTNIPSVTLGQALRVAQAIADNYGKHPTKPLHVAAGMNMSPGSGTFRMICGASIAYGLTTGGYNAESISLTPLGRRIVAPTDEGDDDKAKQEAILKPKLINAFLQRYNDSALPPEKSALNVLEELGAPRAKTKQIFEMIVKSARDVGFIRDIKDKPYVDLSMMPNHLSATKSEVNEPTPEQENESTNDGTEGMGANEPASLAKRVFITHGKNLAFIEPIKKLLLFGELEPVVAMEKQSVAQPVTDKVMNEMRSCGAAIIHIDDERKLMDADTNQHIVLNPNVLIEIGAAIALYQRRFILLVKDGIDLPSNLKGLYEVRYSGESLDSETTIHLLEAIKEMKNHPTQIRYIDA